MYAVSTNEANGNTSPRKFIEIWQTSNSLAEVASKCQRHKDTCRVRGLRYRRRGIPLKDFPPVEVEIIDWDELADYAAELVKARKSPSRPSK